MKNYEKFALKENELKKVVGGGRVTYSTSVDNGNGTRTITYVWFDDVNGNFQWDAGENGKSYIVICPVIQHTNALE